ncbi:MAG: 30S ribosomal protein S5 [Candidatus Pacebacteria bacterium]|nr:30S ribosomal protein S5 [Candidatus Paceibacterota bacterium]
MANHRNNKPRKDREPKEFDEKVISISRVSKKTKGGNKVGFSVLMVVGDKKGQVGVGLGKASDVVGAIKKGIKKAKKKLITVPLDGTTIPFAIKVKKGAGRVMLKPAPKGSGVIAGGPVRAVVEAAGIRDISSKIMGSENQSSSVYATFEALIQITKLVNIKNIKLRSIAQTEAEEKKKLEELQEKAKKAAKASKAEKTEKKEVQTKAEVKPAPKKKVVAKKPAVKKSAAKKEAPKKVVKKVATKKTEKK